MADIMIGRVVDDQYLASVIVAATTKSCVQLCVDDFDLCVAPNSDVQAPATSIRSIPSNGISDNDEQPSVSPTSSRNATSSRLLGEAWFSAESCMKRGSITLLAHV